MNKIKGIIIAVMAIAASLGFAGSATAGPTDTAFLWSGLGSGHEYNGSFNSCTGAIVASGQTQGATGLYQETVTGTYNTATGALTITSVYGLDANGVIDDSTGVNNSAYGYTMTGTVVDNWFSGTYTVTKTPINTGVSETTAPAAFSGVWFAVTDMGGSCTPPPVLDDNNHGQCISGASHAGIKGKALADIAKVVTKVGAYGSSTCPTVAGFPAV